VTGPEVFARIHGPTNFEFAHGHTRFVAIHGEGGVPGSIELPGAGTPEGAEGPRDEDLAFLDHALRAADEPHRVVLTALFGVAEAMEELAGIALATGDAAQAAERLGVAHALRRAIDAQPAGPETDRCARTAEIVRARAAVGG
jgi:hypothetical protein